MLLQRAVGKDAQALQRIDMVTVAAERGARLIQQLLAFARRQPLEPEIVNLGHLMTEVLPMVRRAVGRQDHRRICDAAAASGTPPSTPTQFQTAVLNLAINGRDAMPEGGKLTIEVANATLDEAYAANHPDVEPGQYVMFAITDTGKGMDAATAMRALDPFFTTKPVGEGTGLGLPQVYGFVKQSGGHLKIYSEVGEGTTIKLYLPRSFGRKWLSLSRGNAARWHSPVPKQFSWSMTTKSSARPSHSMLESLGYEVIMAASGARPYQFWKITRQSPFCLRTSSCREQINGRKLAERAVEINPEIKILFTSGYTENAIVHNSRLDPGVEFLSKPYDRERLARKVRRVLDGAVQREPR